MFDRKMLVEMVEDVIGGSAVADQRKREIDSFVGAILGNIKKIDTIANRVIGAL